MFKHILLPTDGSPLSENAILQGVQLARSIGARVTGIHVSPQFQVLTYRTDMLEDTRAEYERDCQVHAERYLAFVAKAAAEGGVPCDTMRALNDDVDQAITDAARERGCDLIAMASHGRRGLGKVLLGSQTQRVATHSSVPVLVWH